jgi:HlyD family secretion protein
MVVYATTGRGNRWSSEEPLQEGQEIRERQELIYLPTASSMMVEVKIHESSLEKVRVGMPARVTVEAAGGRTYDGKVARIALLADAQSAWNNPDLKVYSTDIHIGGDASDLRARMSCRAEIFVASYPDALSVPVQCIVREGGKPTAYVRENGKATARIVEIGLDNDNMVHIKAGLEEGERVLLAPPLHGSAAIAPNAPPPDVPADAPAPKETAEKPADEPAASGETDWRKLSPEERKKRLEQLSPEERKKLMERRQGRDRGGE